MYPANGKQARIKRWNGVGASADPDTIGRWFTAEFPDSNVGIATGPSDLAVIDVDPRNGGMESWRKLCDTAGYDNFASAPCVTTPRGGFHLYFSAPQSVASVKLAAGIDLQAAGAGVIAPPSVCYNKPYSWRSLDGCPDELPALPATICRTVVKKELAHTLQVAPVVNKGDRNMLLTRLAGRFRRAGHTEKEIYGMLNVINVARCVPPLPESEIADIAKSIARRSSRIDPIEWLGKWGSRLSGNELRVALFYALLADRGVPNLTPAEPYATSETGLWPSRFRAARLKLESKGAIRRRSRKGKAPEIFLEPPNVA